MLTPVNLEWTWLVVAPVEENAASLPNPALPVTPLSHLCLCPFLCGAKNRHQPQVVSVLYWF